MEDGALEATLAAAAGDDIALLAELRRAFAESVAQQVDLLGRARCDGNWAVAAMRLKGLGSSFHSTELISLAETALEGAPGDPAILRRLRSYSDKLNANEANNP